MTQFINLSSGSSPESISQPLQPLQPSQQSDVSQTTLVQQVSVQSFQGLPKKESFAGEPESPSINAKPMNELTAEKEKDSLDTNLDRLLDGRNVLTEQMTSMQTIIDNIGVQDIISQIQEGNPIQSPVIFDEALFRAFAHIEVAAVGVNILSRGGILVATGMLLNRVEDVIKEMEYEKRLEITSEEKKAQLDENIKMVKTWLKAQRKEFNEQIKNSVGISLLALPRGVFATARIIDATSRTADMAGNVFIVTSFAGEAIRMHRAGKGLKAHTEWTNALDKGTETVEKFKAILEKQREVQQGRIHEILLPIQGRLFLDSPDLSGIVEDLKRYGLFPPEPFNRDLLLAWCSDPRREEELGIILNKHLSSENVFDNFQDDREAALGEEMEKFFASIEEKLNAPDVDIPAIINELKSAGLKVPFENPGVDNLKEWIGSIERRFELAPQLRNNLEKREMLSVSLRNALKTLCYKKDEIDRGFLKSSLDRSKGRFAAACIMTALTITLKVLLYAGVGSVAAGLALTGYGMIAAIGIATIIGAVYFYVKKPNLFKTYANATQLRLFFQNIPLAIQQYRKNYTALKVTKLLIENEILSVSGKKIPENKAAQLKSLSAKLQQLTKSVQKMEEKVAVLQEKITEAGWSDFYHHLQDNPDNRTVPTQDAATIIAEHLLQDPAVLEDKETQKLLAHMGIDPMQIGKLHNENVQEASAEEVQARRNLRAAQKLRTFFAMDEEITVELAKKQIKQANAAKAAEAENG